jgi:hypothetical protein
VRELAPAFQGVLDISWFRIRDAIQGGSGASVRRPEWVGKGFRNPELVFLLTEFFSQDIINIDVSEEQRG